MHQLRSAVPFWVPLEDMQIWQGNRTYLKPGQATQLWQGTLVTALPCTSSGSPYS